MKLYRLINDTDCVLTTFDPIKVVDAFEKLSKDADSMKGFFVWLDTEEV